VDHQGFEPWTPWL